jgi:hypothetical protein
MHINISYAFCQYLHEHFYIIIDILQLFGLRYKINEHLFGSKLDSNETAPLRDGLFFVGLLLTT